MVRTNAAEMEIHPNGVSYFLKKLSFEDITFLLLALLIASAADYGLVMWEDWAYDNLGNGSLLSYAGNLFFHIRIYLPLIIFSIAIYKLTTKGKLIFTWQKLLYLYIFLWLFNEFAFDLYVWVRDYVFSLLLLPFASGESFYLFESMLGVPLIAFYFLGYHSAMTFAMKEEVEEKIDIE